MPPLSRQAAKLLSKVGGQPHAEQDDHVEPLRKISNNCLRPVDREPDSSSEDELANNVTSTFKRPGQRINASRPPSVLPPSKKRPSPEPDFMEQAATTRASRTANGPKKRRLTPEKVFKSKRQRERDVERQEHERKVKREGDAKAKEQNRTKFKMPGRLNDDPEVVPQPKFQQLEGVPIQRPSFVSQSGSASVPSSSGAAIDLSLDDTDIIDVSDGPDNDSINRCESCGAEVDPMIRESFEIEHNFGKRWTFKWQSRFCDYHKRQDAENLWNEKGYPQIDWNKLPGRLRTAKRISRIREILSGKKQSHFQADQEKAVRGRKKTAQQYLQVDVDRNEKGRTGAGYYGLRGERLIIDHITQKFGDDLRARSTSDKVVAASGLGGGMSGFISAVLVPEMATSLISEDLDCGDEQAVQVVKDSSELGDLLHPEPDKKSRPEVVEFDD